MTTKAKQLETELGRSEAIAQFVSECVVAIGQLSPGLEYQKVDLDGFVRGCWPTEDEPIDVACDFVRGLADAE